MKKYLSILAAIGLAATSTSSVVACGNKTTPTVVNETTPIMESVQLGKTMNSLIISGNNFDKFSSIYSISIKGENIHPIDDFNRAYSISPDHKTLTVTLNDQLVSKKTYTISLMRGTEELGVKIFSPDSSTIPNPGVETVEFNSAKVNLNTNKLMLFGTNFDKLSTRNDNPFRVIVRELDEQGNAVNSEIAFCDENSFSINYDSTIISITYNKDSWQFKSGVAYSVVLVDTGLSPETVTFKAGQDNNLDTRITEVSVFENNLNQIELSGSGFNYLPKNYKVSITLKGKTTELELSNNPYKIDNSGTSLVVSLFDNLSEGATYSVKLTVDDQTSEQELYVPFSLGEYETGTTGSKENIKLSINNKDLKDLDVAPEDLNDSLKLVYKDDPDISLDDVTFDVAVDNHNEDVINISLSVTFKTPDYNWNESNLKEVSLVLTDGFDTNIELRTFNLTVLNHTDNQFNAISKASINQDGDKITVALSDGNKLVKEVLQKDIVFKDNSNENITISSVESQIGSDTFKINLSSKINIEDKLNLNISGFMNSSTLDNIFVYRNNMNSESISQKATFESTESTIKIIKGIYGETLYSVSFNLRPGTGINANVAPMSYEQIQDSFMKKIADYQNELQIHDKDGNRVNLDMAGVNGATNLKDNVLTIILSKPTSDVTLGFQGTDQIEATTLTAHLPN